MQPRYNRLRFGVPLGACGTRSRIGQETRWLLVSPLLSIMVSELEPRHPRKQCAGCAPLAGRKPRLSQPSCISSVCRTCCGRLFRPAQLQRDKGRDSRTLDVPWAEGRFHCSKWRFLSVHADDIITPRHSRPLRRHNGLGRRTDRWRRLTLLLSQAMVSPRAAHSSYGYFCAPLHVHRRRSMTMARISYSYTTPQGFTIYSLLWGLAGRLIVYKAVNKPTLLTRLLKWCAIAPLPWLAQIRLAALPLEKSALL